jgi:cytochrome c-type biogenesis protein CcmH/NrfG
VLSGHHKRLRQVAPHLPRSVEKIVERCLAVDPAKRYQRAGDLCRALDRLLAAVLRGTRSARVVAFLRERELVEATDITLIASDELDAAKPRVRAETVLKARHFERSESQAVRAGVGRGVLIALIVLVFLACSVMALSFVAPEWSRGRLAQVSAWIGADSAPEVKPP